MKTSVTDQGKRTRAVPSQVTDGESSEVTWNELSLNRSAAAGESADLPSSTSPFFDAWLKSIQPLLVLDEDPGSFSETRSSAEPLPEPPPVPGEFRFEGTLRVDCFITGLVRSCTGTLVVSETGEASTDLFVPVAIIDGLVRGDIKATQRVEIGSSAKVIGNIETPSLRIEPGAVFEGRCHFVESSRDLVDEPDQQTPAEIHWPSRLRPRGVTTVPDEADAEPLVAAAGR
jgi:cytoskeletal protein CcmA (bactofilin family)